MVSCADFLGRDKFESYSEFIFMLCVAKEYYRRGDLMDFSMMNISDFLSDSHKCFLRWCVYHGYVYIYGSNVSELKGKEPFAFNLDAITANENDLFEKKNGRYEWSNDWAKQRNYGKYWKDLYFYSDLGSILLHIIAHQIVAIREGDIENKPIYIYIDNCVVNSTYIYVNLISLIRTVPWFRKMVEVDVDYDGKAVDIDFSLFVNSGIQAGRRHYWSIKDKVNQLKSEGLVEGCICILYERKGVSDSNNTGKITNANIIRLDRVTNAKIIYTTIPIYRTKEEVETDYNEIPPENQRKFDDMLEFNVYLKQNSLDLYNVGISTYLCREDYFICPIDKFGTTDKLITIDGHRAMISMSQIDAIYYLLKQYGISFDEKLYKLMYNEGNGFTYDLYDCTYEDHAVRVIRGTILDKK